MCDAAVLLRACRRGDVHLVETLQRRYGSKALLHVKDARGATCLHYAARGGHVAVLKQLTANGATDTAPRTRVGATPLHDAAVLGELCAIKWLVQQTACSLRDTDRDGCTVLHLAARYGRVHVLRWLLWEAEMPALERSNNGALALHYAAARGCLDCVKLLVESSSELSANTQMDNDVTPVYLAAQEGHLEVLKFLVTQAGGSLYVRAKDGMAPVHAASQMGCLACLKWMIQEQGVDPNLRDGDGATPLHFAASRGHVDTVRWLLRHGARLVLDKFGKSPINDAAENQQLECLSVLMQHADTEPAPTAVKTQPPRGRPIEVTNGTGNPTLHETPHYFKCCAGAGSREPFFLHPPTLHRAVQPDGLYINPAHSHGNTNDPFFLHNPREVVYNRVKDLFEPQPLQPQQTVAVKVEVHSGSSDENLSSSDLSERSADPENDYEEIYQSRDPATTAVRRRSRDSGSHSRSGSSSSSNSHMVVTAPPPPPGDNHETPSTTVSTDLEPVSMLDTILNSFDEDRTAQESGVSSGSPSDLGHSEEECEKTKVSHRHSLPHLQHSTNNSRALKRVVSEPGAMCPPPPPPPPPAEEGSSTPPSPNHRSRSPSPSPVASALEVVEEPTLKPSEVVQRGGSVLKPATSSQSLAQHLVNKQMVLPFVPPRFPSSNGDSNSLIKPSEYLRSLRPADEVAPQPEQQQPPQQPPSPPQPPPAATTDAPAPPPLPEEPEPTPVKQPLGAISIQDLHSVQLRKTSDKMQAPPPPKNTVEQPFLAQKEDLIAELKMSKDITGIKKLKVERAKVEEQHEKEMFTEITKQLTANSFVEKIPDKDATGNPIPAWKRQMLAKKAAERARKELEEQMLKEAEEKRLQAIPPWKRQLLAKKEDDSRKTNLYTPRVVDDKKPKPSKPEEVLRQQIPSNSETDNNKENKTPATQPEKEPQSQHTPAKEEPKEEPEQIIPWRAQLRKTNSKLSLLE